MEPVKGDRIGVLPHGLPSGAAQAVRVVWVRSGTFGVNEGYIMDPAAPFGGVKNSGYGRELGVEGIDGYTVSQSISVAG